MGGLGPGIGGLEILVIGLLALIVVGPKDLPLLLRKVGRAVGKARAMAGEFRSSFDEMARQSELDELRREVEALRTGQGIVPLGAEAEAAFRDISTDLNALPAAPTAALPGPTEWPDNPPTMTPLPSPKTTSSSSDGPTAKVPRRRARATASPKPTDASVPMEATPTATRAATPIRKPSARKKADQ